MERTTVYLSEDLRRRLAATARTSRRPQAELIREALDEYLDRQSRPRPTFIGMANDPGVDSEVVKAWVRSEWDRKWTR